MTEVSSRAVMLREIDPREHGEAFNDLTEKQQLFVMALIEAGLHRDMGARAARTAGYAESAAKQTAWLLMRHKKVIAALREEAELRMQAGAYIGAMVLHEIALDEKHKDRFKAATEMMNRGGMSHIQQIEHRHAVTVEDNRLRPELVAAIRNLAQQAGMDPAKLLGSAEPVDAQFTEVIDPPTDETDSDGLEDLV